MPFYATYSKPTRREEPGQQTHIAAVPLVERITFRHARIRLRETMDSSPTWWTKVEVLHILINCCLKKKQYDTQEATQSGRKRWRAIVNRAILQRRRHTTMGFAASVSNTLAARRGLKWVARPDITLSIEPQSLINS